jgi:hypothetical protein
MIKRREGNKCTKGIIERIKGAKDEITKQTFSQRYSTLECIKASRPDDEVGL